MKEIFSVFRLLALSAVPWKRDFVTVLILGILAFTIQPIVAGQLLGSFVKSVADGNINGDWAVKLLVLLFLVRAASIGLMVWRSYVEERFLASFNLGVRLRLIRAALGEDEHCVVDAEVANDSSVIISASKEDLHTVRVWFGEVTMLLSEVLFTPICIIFVATRAPVLAIELGVLVIGMIVVGVKMSRMHLRRFQVRRSQQEELAGSGKAIALNIERIVLSRVPDLFSRHWGLVVERLKQVSIAEAGVLSGASALSWLFTIGSTFLVLRSGFSGHDRIGPGEIAALVFYIQYFTWFTDRAVRILRTSSSAGKSAGHLRSLIEGKHASFSPSVINPKNSPPERARRWRGALQWMKKRDGVWVLPSTSYFDSGKILASIWTDSNQIESKDLTSNTTPTIKVSLMPENFFLFDASIEENVFFDHKPDITSMRKVSWMAGLDIAFKNEGLDWQTRIGCAGIRLSAGQRQRVALARCFAYSAETYLLNGGVDRLDELLQLELVGRWKTLRGVTILLGTDRPSVARAVGQCVPFDRSDSSSAGTTRSARTPLRPPLPSTDL